MSPRPRAAVQPSARLWLFPVLAGLALLTFFQFPGHTWLQQDTQIYIPILEHLRDPAVLRNDPIAQHPHVAFTLYDETALALRRATGLGFRQVLEAQQLITRALGIWGLFLLAESLGFATAASLFVAAICSLGAVVAGPTVLTFEYEAIPRAFAVPLIFCAIGLAANRRWMPAAIAASAAFLYHPPTTIPFWLLFAPLLLLRRRWRELAVPAAAAVVLLVAARLQGGDHTAFFARLAPAMEQLQRLRTSYVWISTWPAATILHYAVLSAVVIAALLWLGTMVGQPFRAVMPGFRPACGGPKPAAALARPAILQHLLESPALLFLLGLPLLGLLSMPVSWLLLERLKWSLVPQLQPMRALLFVTLAAQFLSAAAGLRARSRLESCFWFALALLPPVQPLLTAPWLLRPLAVVLVLAAFCCLRPSFRLPAALAAFFLIPIAGGMVNYPRLDTPPIQQLSAWARASTPPDSVFLFPAARKSFEPGVFRCQALRALYVDWKGGGQVNYLNDFAQDWWFRWQQTMARQFRPSDLPRYAALGIQYIVLPRGTPLRQMPVYANDGYAVYQVK